MTQGIGLPGQVVPVLGVIGEMAWIVNGQSPLQDQTADKIGLIADTLNLTEATDYVMDAKGETVFRRRPYYYVLEALTKRRLRDGLIDDEISSRLIATRTPVLSSRRMTKAAREFVRLNYVPIAFRLRVLGQVLRQKETQSVAPCPFEVTIPARYTIVTPSGIPSGILDGTVLLGFRYLEAGHHEFIPDRSEGKIVLVWARAIESGYSPFAEIKGDLTTDQD
jgi:hypothetical protein